MKSKKTGGYVIEINFKSEGVKDYRPDAFYNITGIADLSEMIKYNHLKMLINGEEYWIPFIKGQKIGSNDMKVELSKREIEVIIDLMSAGVTFLVTHTWADKPIKKGKERININELEEKLKKYLK